MLKSSLLLFSFWIETGLMAQIEGERLFAQDQIIEINLRVDSPDLWVLLEESDISTIPFSGKRSHSLLHF